MNKYFRHRNYTLVGGSLLVILFLYLTDPNDGILTAAFLSQLATPIIAVWFAYLASKAIFDNIDVGSLYYKARQSAIGAGLIFVGICIVFFGLLGLFGSSAHAQDVNTYVPEKAQIYLPVVKNELNTIWVTHPKKL